MQVREKIVLDHDWQFVRRRMPRGWLRAAADGADVDLPHCWNERDAFQDGVAYYRGWGSYRRTFRMEKADAACRATHRWHLVSEGFYGTGDVWLNGRRLGKVDGQYLGFRFDVTDALVFGVENRLGVRLTNRCRTDVLPGIRMPDFLLYGGLSGRVWLERLPVVRIEDVCVRSRFDAQGHATVVIEHVLTGDPPPDRETAWRILDHEGVAVAGASAPAASGRTCLDLPVPEPRRWDVDDPYLYRLEGTLRAGETCIDRVTVSFGIRSAEFRPGEGFFLNGRRVPLRGCNRHESMPGFGRALPLWLHRADAELIKDMGLNFVRLSHYPQHPSFLDACDALGILVYAEIASWKSVRGGRWLKRALDQMRAMIVRDRCHPSVILWGMGNEGRQRGAYRRLYALCKRLDPDRAVTYAENHLYRARRKRTLGIPDVWGVNYEIEALDAAAAAARLRNVVVSECANYPHAERGNPDAERRQLDMLRHDLAEIERNPFVAGFALWCFNDYATLRKQRYKRFSGVVDAWRVPKASAHWLSRRFGGTLAGPDAAVAPGDEALTLVLTPERAPARRVDRETIVVRVTVANQDGLRCAWNGDLKAAVRGPANLRCFDDAGTVRVSEGVGRVFVTPTGPPGPIGLTVAGAGAGSQTIEIETV